MNPKAALTVMNRSILALLVLATVGCSNLLGPDGTYLPTNPGTLVVRVRDESGVPVPGARVSVEMPNAVGSLFTESSQTDSEGTHSFYYVPAGIRRVEVAPPSGFAASATSLIQDVEVVKGQSTTVDFAVVRTRR
jgi:hypothetical protein